MGKSTKKNPRAVIYEDMTGKEFNLGTVYGKTSQEAERKALERVNAFKRKRGSIF